MTTARRPLSTLNPQPSTSPRLAIVLSHPTQYYSPWFRWLRAHTELSFRVFYLWDFGVTERTDPKFETTFRWDVDLLSGYEHELVPNVAREPGTHHFAGLDNPALTARLEAWAPAAVLLFGYKWRSHLRVVWWARRRGVPLLFRGDSHFLGRGRPAVSAWLALRALYAQFAAFLPVGAANRDYFRTLGVPEKKLFFAPHAVDGSLFDPERADHRAAASRLRRELGLAPRTLVVLFAGKLVPEKQPLELLAAFQALRPEGAALVFVGEGPEKTKLQAIARDVSPEVPASSGGDVAGASVSPVADPASAGRGFSIHFLPFANQSEMPARYLLADLFVLPSRGHYETWGLAVNEAMHLGVPCLVSDVVGCQRDLVSHGETGWVFRAGDSADLQAQLAAALATLRSPEAVALLRAAVASRIGNYSYARAAQGLSAALAAMGLPIR